MKEEYIYQDAYFTSFSELDNPIRIENRSIVCTSMPAIGMECNLNNDVFNLIELYLKSSDEWIRRAGYLCIYHLRVRFSNDIFSDRLISIINKGMLDNTKPVLDIISCIIDEMEEFNQNAYSRLYS